MLQRRIEDIRHQVDDNVLLKISFRKAFFFSLLLLTLVAYVMTLLFGSAPPKEPDAPTLSGLHSESEAQTKSTHGKWERETQHAVTERIVWLRDSWYGVSTAELYRNIANATVASLSANEPVNHEEGEIDFFASAGRYCSQVIAGVYLRFTFAMIIAWPLWLLGLVAGFLYFLIFIKPVETKDILGVCSRKLGPFYSGIYGPLRPNGSVSATDYSCPGLACPSQAPATEAQKHNLYRTLKHYSALNGTTEGLIRIILAYRDLPAFVEEERVVEEEPEVPGAPVIVPTPGTHSPIRTNDEGTIEESALEGLLCMLSAHQALQSLYGKDATPIDDEQREEHLFGTQRERLAKIAANLRPIARGLTLCLTPSRARALAHVPATVIASAYLATEAGKSLVYRREGKAFVQFSRFPHLQARAVLQSVLAYHQEFDGDTRLTIRHAIISSRRHGDFGRAFLPTTMSQASHALRDWLEVMYSPVKKRLDIANLVELDAHIEEIHINWRKRIAARLTREQRQELSTGQLSSFEQVLWKGVPFKSVVLVPLADLVEGALYGFSPARISRVTDLIQLTRKLQASVSISARLPGFKRQAEEAEKGGLESGGITKTLAERGDRDSLVERWLIVRRMLTRFNWLSTRVGDDAVPVDGLVQAIIVHRATEKTEALGMSSVVPLRQRRFREMLGLRWETVYYASAPRGGTIQVLVDTDEYDKTLQMRQEQSRKGLLDHIFGVSAGTPPHAEFAQ